MNKIIDVVAFPLVARFEDIYGGIDKVPKSLLFPGASFAAYPRYGQYSVIVKVIAEDGMVGYGECWGLPNPKPAAILVNELIAPMLVGKDARDTSVLFGQLASFAERIGHTRGITMEAIAGVDIALWDLKGKLLNVPAHTIMGGKHHERIECYASPIQYFATTQETRARTREMLDLGFQAVKVKVGRGIETDLAHVAAVRAEAGSHVRIMLDMNCGYDVRSAIQFAREVEPIGITWFEEPIPPEDIDGLAAIHRAIHIPLATGENEFTASGYREMVKRGAVDILMPNISRVGVTGMLNIHALARTFGVRLAPHGVGAGITIASTIQTLAACSEAYLFEYNQLLNPLRHEIIEGFPNFQDGFMEVHDRPGFGYVLNEESLVKYRV